MEKSPSYLKLVVAEAASPAQNDELSKIFQEALENAGVRGLFNHMLASGFTLITTEPDNRPGLKITLTKDTLVKNKPLSFTLVLTESATRGPNQPDIHYTADDEPGMRPLAGILDIYSTIEKWAFRNLPRITKTVPDKGMSPGLCLR